MSTTEKSDRDDERGGARSAGSARFIVGGLSGAKARTYENVALEEAILRRNRGLTVRVWTNERSVVIGRAQLAEYETDLEYCRTAGIPVVRRITAGGTVYHGPGNVNWSLFVGRDFRQGDIRYVWDVTGMFAMAAGLVIKVADRCGVKTWLDEPNRILSDEGKVSGMAAYISRDGLLCHGTFLLAADLEEAKRVTEPRRVSIERRYTRSRPMRMANTRIEQAAFIAAFREVTKESTGVELEDTEPGDDEVDAVDELVRSKYGDPRWNLGDPFREERSGEGSARGG